MHLPQVVDQVTLTTNTGSLSSDITPQAVLTAMQRVADWQLAHPITLRPTGWICAVGDVGMMALAGISGDPKYRDAMLAKGETNGWQLAQYQGRKYHADDQCYGQICAELYFLYRDNRMIAPMREHFDWILANPPANTNLDFAQRNHGQDLWSWCDALFMAPPAWLRLYAATGDERYHEFCGDEFLAHDGLSLRHERRICFSATARSSTSPRRTARKFSGAAATAGLSPGSSAAAISADEHPDRPRFEQLFKDMAGKILSLQQPDGTVAREPARPGGLSDAGSQRLGDVHLRPRVGREPRAARPREI